MNPVVKAQLKEFSERHQKEALKESEFFEVLSIHAVENGILGESVDPFKIHLAGEEFGIDGIAILIQGEVCVDSDAVAQAISVGKNHQIEFHFFQSKTSESIAYGDVGKFLDAVVDFFQEGKLAASAQIADLRGAKDKAYEAPTKSNPSIRCFFCSTGSGEIADPIKKLIETNRARLEALSLFSEIDISILGAKQLQAGYRSATNSISASFDFPRSITLPDHPSVEEAFIGFVAAHELINLVTLEGTAGEEPRINRSVFYDNIRDFSPNSEINKSIISEIENGDDLSFIFKNNGVTIVAKEINRKSDTFHIDDFQIVNGCQTTNILFNSRDLVGKVNVPLRLIGTKDPDFISTIIVGTNKQNEVKEDQFWALVPFMKDLEEYCRSQSADDVIFIERRENQYRDLAVERTRISKPADLMKAIAAMFLGQPNRAARDYRGIRREFKDRIFQPGHNIELYHLAALAGYKFDFAVRNSRVDRSRGIYKFYALFALIKMFWPTGDLLDAQKKKQDKVLSDALAVLRDEEKFVAHIEAVAKTLDDQIASQSLSTREQIRDYIRTESAVEKFVELHFEKEETQQA